MRFMEIELSRLLANIAPPAQLLICNLSSDEGIDVRFVEKELSYRDDWRMMALKAHTVA